MDALSKIIVISIGVIPTFKVIFTPLEYVLSSYVINICFVLFKQREGLQQVSSTFLTVQGSKSFVMMLQGWIMSWLTIQLAFDVYIIYSLTQSDKSNIYFKSIDIYVYVAILQIVEIRSL